MVCIAAARSGFSKNHLHRVDMSGKGAVCRVATSFTNRVVKPVKFEGIVVRIIQREPPGRATVVAVVVLRRDCGEFTPKIFMVNARVLSSDVVVGCRWVIVWRVGRLHRSCVVC